MSKHYYGDIDPYVCRWLENLCLEGLIPDGDVDDRSIVDVTAADVRGYTQAHFFCGIAGWPLALKLAGWSSAREVWTGSCPCQPFSAAGAGAGFDDERHLWPHFFRLIRECRPAAVFGEQVASKAVDAWIDLVLADLESVGYAGGAIAFPSAGVGAPHIRDRTYWLGYSDDARSQGHAGNGRAAGRQGSQRSVASAGVSDGLGDAVRRRSEEGHDGLAARGQRQAAIGASVGSGARRLADSARERLDEAGQRLTQARRDGAAGDDGFGGLGHADIEPGQRRTGSVSRAQAPIDSARREDGRGDHGLADAGEGVGERPGATNDFWRDADWLACRDGKWRPVEPSAQQVVDGLSAGVGCLRANRKEAEVLINASVTEALAAEALRQMREGYGAETIWLSLGRRIGFPQATVLFAAMCQHSRELGAIVHSEAARGAQVGQAELRALRQGRETSRAPQRREFPEQLLEQSRDLVSELSQASPRFGAAVIALSGHSGGPLAHKVASRVGRLRAYGNAINPRQAAIFLEAVMECMP